MRAHREVALWRDATDAQWADWRWQVANRVQTVEQLRHIMPLSASEATAIGQCLTRFRMAVTPYFASLIDPHDPDCPIRKQAVPSPAELQRGSADLDDPLGEERQSPFPNLTHRYPDRALMLITDMCATYCRHCTRRRLVGATDRAMSKGHIDRCINYIRAHREVRDVLVSGGDPLLCSDQGLEHVLSSLRAVPHVEIIRIGTRAPVVLPQRITPELTRMIARYHPVWMNVQFNHPRELTDDAVAALGRLADAGVPLGNQTVLLRGVNDCPHVMRELVHGLLRARVRPYYLYQCDLAVGIDHFRTPISRGLEIIEALRGHTSGLAVPTFVVDAPGGGGKIPVMPQYFLGYAGGRAMLRNHDGSLCYYPEPAAKETPGVCPLCGGTHREFMPQPAYGLQPGASSGAAPGVALGHGRLAR